MCRLCSLCVRVCLYVCLCLSACLPACLCVCVCVCVCSCYFISLPSVDFILSCHNQYHIKYTMSYNLYLSICHSLSLAKSEKGHTSSVEDNLGRKKISSTVYPQWFSKMHVRVCYVNKCQMLQIYYKLYQACSFSVCVT